MLVGMAMPYRTLKLPKRMSCVAAGDPGILSISDTVFFRGYIWGTTQEDSEYSGILSIPDTVCGVCMGGQLRRIPSIPGYLVFQTLFVWRLYVWGANSGGSQVSRDT